MLEVYTLNIKEEITDIEYYQLLDMVDENKRERIQRYRFKDDSKRSLYGDIVIRYWLMAHYSISNELIQMETNQYGKPYIVGTPLYFNISHSGDYVIVAISNEEVGVDIETIQDSHLDIAKRFFVKEEYEKIVQVEENQQAKEFCTYWTLKESYVKYIGKGLSKSLNSFSVLQEHNHYVIKGEDSTVKLISLDLGSEYMVAVASPLANEELKLSELSIRSIIDDIFN